LKNIDLAEKAIEATKQARLLAETQEGLTWTGFVGSYRQITGDSVVFYSG
jgi:hypothetical protein